MEKLVKEIYNKYGVEFVAVLDKDGDITLQRYTKNNKRVTCEHLGLTENDAISYLEGFKDALEYHTLPKSVQWCIAPLLQRTRSLILRLKIIKNLIYGLLII